jgi:hypothetical protein
MERWEPIRRLGPTGGVYVTPQYSFGSDAMLLAHFSAPRGQKTICELGTGCGIISILWCGGPPWMRRRPMEITAVEIQKPAAMLAARSVARNGLQDKIRVVNADWRDLDGVLSAGSFERVVCNPPYFPAQSGDVSEDDARRIARHEDGPDALDTLCASAARLLQNGGTLKFPAERMMLSPVKFDEYFPVAADFPDFAGFYRCAVFKKQIRILRGDVDFTGIHLIFPCKKIVLPNLRNCIFSKAGALMNPPIAPGVSGISQMMVL